MQCKGCGRTYTGILKACPYCGNPTYNNTVYPNKVATFLARPREVGNLVLSNMNLMLVLFINLSLAALIVNLFTLKDSGLWFQYVGCGSFCLYNIMRGFFGARETALRTVRRALNFSMVALAISALYNIGKNDNITLPIAQFVLPAIIIGINVLAVAFLIFKLATSGSFGFTCILNTVFSLILLIIALCNAELYTSATLIYVAFGFSAFALANHILLSFLSVMTKFKRGF